jgi:hypothetical protein
MLFPLRLMLLCRRLTPCYFRSDDFPVRTQRQTVNLLIISVVLQILFLLINVMSALAFTQLGNIQKL